MFDMHVNNPMCAITQQQAAERINQIVSNVQGEKMQIIRYGNATNIDIKFLDTGNIIYHQCYSNFIKGSLLDHFLPTVFGHGIVGNVNIRANGILTKEYLYWSGMLKRCYGEADLKRYPSYKKCTIEKDWMTLQNFKEWFNDNYYECGEETMCLDKDILCKNNTIYSADHCIFVPERINILFTKTNANRGQYPIGVYYKKKNKKFVAQVSKIDPITNKKKAQEYLGLFDTPEDAFNAYKNAKEAYIKEVADYYQQKYDAFPQKLYDALYAYEVEITD